MHAVLWPYINWETRVFVFLKWFCHTAGQINVNYNWTSAKKLFKNSEKLFKGNGDHVEDIRYTLFSHIFI